MSKIGRHIALVINLICLIGVASDGMILLAQDTLTSCIIFNCVPIIDGGEIKEGDRIFIIENSGDSVDSTLNFMTYNPEASNRITTTVFVRDTLEQNAFNFQFRYYSVNRNCYIDSDKITYQVDTQNSTAYDTTYITSFEVSTYDIGYETEQICQTEAIVPLISELPLDMVELGIDKELVTNEVGDILPLSNIPGTYNISFKSEYCLIKDTVAIEIIEPVDIILPDTLKICQGESLDESLSDSDYLNISTGDGTPVPSTSISESGYYYFESAVEQCGSGDSAFIDVLPIPEINIETEQECDQIIVRVTGIENEPTTVNWANGDTGQELLLGSTEEINMVVEVIFSNGCQAEKATTVQNKPFEVGEVTYQVTEADCWTEGKLNIQDILAFNAQGMIEYKLSNTLTGEVLYDLNNIREGAYRLAVYDERGCEATKDEIITVIQKCREEYPVFTPDFDGQEDEYFIPHQGVVKIYNREGRLIKELNTPAYWDGTDDSGNEMPMGNYVMVTDDNRIVNITIVK